MKLRGEILMAKTLGNKLSLELQAQPVPIKAWRPWLHLEIQLETTVTAQRAYHVGRVVEITVKPK